MLLYTLANLKNKSWPPSALNPDEIAFKKTSRTHIGTISQAAEEFYGFLNRPTVMTHLKQACKWYFKMPNTHFHQNQGMTMNKQLDKN